MESEVFKNDLLKHCKRINGRQLLSIGIMAQITGLSVRSIRHYCDNSIVTPAYIDTSSGYRYFEPEQISAFLLIKEMRKFDFPLDDIKEAFTCRTLDEAAGYFLKQQEKIAEEIKQLENKRDTLGYMIQNFHHIAADAGEENNFVCSIKQLPERTVVWCGKNTYYADGLEFKKGFENNDRFITGNNLKNKEIRLSLHDRIKNFDSKIDIEYCTEIEKSGLEHEKIKKIGEAMYGSMVFTGEYDRLHSEGYPHFEAWLAHKGCRTKGRFIEVYLVTRPISVLGILPVTEIQIEIENLID